MLPVRLVAQSRRPVADNTLRRSQTVPALLHEIQVEGAFLDGVFLVTVYVLLFSLHRLAISPPSLAPHRAHTPTLVLLSHDPIASPHGDLELALYGSFLPIPKWETFSGGDEDLKREELPGAIVFKQDAPIPINVGRNRVRVKVTNTGDRPIQVSAALSCVSPSPVADETVVVALSWRQVGSHFHFTEVNKALRFDRSLSFFRRLDIAAGTAVRFEPGDTKTVTLVDIAGNQIVTGGNFLLNTSAAKLVEESERQKVLDLLVQKGFGHEKQEGAVVGKEVQGVSLSRETYASMYGPTTGDRIRLGDTELWIEIEKDLTVHGDELKFGGGVSLRTDSRIE